ncbi:unnamed protein product [Urochloa humidicola]
MPMTGTSMPTSCSGSSPKDDENPLLMCYVQPVTEQGHVAAPAAQHGREPTGRRRDLHRLDPPAGASPSAPDRRPPAGRGRFAMT